MEEKGTLWGAGGSCSLVAFHRQAAWLSLLTLRSPCSLIGKYSKTHQCLGRSESSQSPVSTRGLESERWSQACRCEGPVAPRTARLSELPWFARVGLRCLISHIAGVLICVAWDSTEKGKLEAPAGFPGALSSVPLSRWI